MRLWAIALLICLIVYHHGAAGDHSQDNEFAEFEDFDDPVKPEVATEEAEKPNIAIPKNPSPADDDDDDAIVEVEDEDENKDPFDEEWDPDEFDPTETPQRAEAGELKIAKVPYRHNSWTNYYVEIMIGVLISIYLVNFLIGSSKNNSIASSWLQTHLEFLKDQFELVGDDPTNQKAASTHQMIKESEHTYILWCSGRQCCEGMLVQLKLLKRQDIISNIVNRLTPGMDQLQISIRLEHMDPFVFCMGQKRSVIALQKNMTDVGLFCGDRLRSGEKFGFSPSIAILSELAGEVVSSVLDTKVAKVLREHEHLIDSIHISDQFSGPKLVDQEEAPVKEPETSKIINITLNIPAEWNGAENMENLLPLVKLSVYLVDKITRLRLSKESKQRADRHRQEMHLRFLKQTHALRQEAAQLKREEKDRQLKDRMMNEEDPDKQRRLDEMIQRREQNKKNKRMMKGRQYKVKSM